MRVGMIKAAGFIRKNAGAIALNALVCFFTVSLVLDPKRCISSVYSGLVLFATNVAPALFPFFFFTKLLTSLGTASVLGKALRRPVAALYNAPPIGGYIYLMSVVSGYPVGARLIGDMYRSGVIDADDARCISTFTSTSGPLFIVGTVGTMMFGDPVLGYIAMACHFIGALLNGLIYRRKTPSAPKAEFSPACTDSLLGSGMTEAITSILLVGGYIAVFSMVIDVLSDIGAVDALASPLRKLLGALGQDPDIAEALVVGSIELTRGCKLLAELGLQTKTALPYLAGMLSFGGLSIAFQSLAFCSACKIKTSFFALSKLTQAIVTVALSSLVALLL